MSPWRVVSFDLMNCLLKLKHPIGETYSNVLSNYGVRLSQEQTRNLNETFRISIKDTDSRLPCYGVPAGFTPQEWWRQVVLQTFRRAGVIGEAKKMIAAADELFDVYSTNDEWELDSDASVVLSHLVQRGLKVGIISNWDHRIYKVLENFDVLKWFDFSILSSEVQVAKPDSGIFFHAFKKASTFVDKSHISTLADCWVHVGNDWLLDCVAARKAGIKLAVRYSCFEHDKKRPDELYAAPGIIEIKRLSNLEKKLFDNKKP